MLILLTGVLQCLDGYMNIAMEQTEEHVDGKVTNRYGDAFIRGNNGVFYIYFLISISDRFQVLYISAGEPI